MSLAVKMFRPPSADSEARPDATPSGVRREPAADLAALADLLRKAPPSEDAAAEYLRLVMASRSERPLWLPAAQELWWRGGIVKSFRRDADNQTAVLAAFQKEGWPRRIDDPLPRVAGRNPKSCRRETIKSLNRGLARGTIRFYAAGAGGIRWEEDASTALDKTPDRPPL